MDARRGACRRAERWRSQPPSAASCRVSRREPGLARLLLVIDSVEGRALPGKSRRQENRVGFLVITTVPRVTTPAQIDLRGDDSRHGGELRTRTNTSEKALGHGCDTRVRMTMMVSDEGSRA
jgi:hypothetical protein